MVVFPQIGSHGQKCFLFKQFIGLGVFCLVCDDQRELCEAGGGAVHSRQEGERGRGDAGTGRAQDGHPGEGETGDQTQGSRRQGNR